MKYEFHELAEMLPLMNESDLRDLAADIMEHGQLIPAVLLEGKILDGRNRYRACQMNKIELRAVNYTKDQARAYVLGANLYRRHYDRKEYMHFVRKLVDLQDTLGMSNEDVAKATGKSKSTVKRVKQEKKEKGVKTPKSEPLVNKNGEKFKDTQLVDVLKVPIPEGDASYNWHRRDFCDEIVKKLHVPLLEIEKIAKDQKDDAMWRQFDLQTVIMDLRNAYSRFKAGIPTYVCTKCDGVSPRGCDLCLGTGMVGTYRWDNCGDDDHKRKKQEREANARSGS